MPNPLNEKTKKKINIIIQNINISGTQGIPVLINKINARIDKNNNNWEGGSVIVDWGEGIGTFNVPSSGKISDFPTLMMIVEIM